MENLRNMAGSIISFYSQGNRLREVDASDFTVLASGWQSKYCTISATSGGTHTEAGVPPLGMLHARRFPLWVGDRKLCIVLASCHSLSSGICPFWPAEGSTDILNFLKPMTRFGSPSLCNQNLSRFPGK